MRITKKLIDRALELQEIIAPLNEELSAIKDAVKDAGDGTYLGRDAEIVVTTSGTNTLDSRKVKALLTPTQIAACTTEGIRTSVKIKSRLAKLKAAA